VKLKLERENVVFPEVTVQVGVRAARLPQAMPKADPVNATANDRVKNTDFVHILLNRSLGRSGEKDVRKR